MEGNGVTLVGFITLIIVHLKTKRIFFVVILLLTLTTLHRMQSIIIFTLLGSVSAFLPPAPLVVSSPTILNANELDIGVTAPLGLFDPLNLIRDAPEKFERRRAVERKHGRIAMVAVVGNLIHNAGIELPGMISPSQGIAFHDIPDGFKGLFAVPAAGLFQILLVAGFMEVAIWPANNYSGDYG